MTQEERDDERLEYEKMAVHQECLRRAIEASSQAIKTIAEAHRNSIDSKVKDALMAEDIVWALKGTLEEANKKLNTKLTNMK